MLMRPVRFDLGPAAAGLGGLAMVGIAVLPAGGFSVERGGGDDEGEDEVSSPSSSLSDDPGEPLC